PPAVANAVSPLSPLYKLLILSSPTRPPQSPCTVPNSSIPTSPPSNSSFPFAFSLLFTLHSAWHFPLSPSSLFFHFAMQVILHVLLAVSLHVVLHFSLPVSLLFALNFSVLFSVWLSWPLSWPLSMDLLTQFLTFPSPLPPHLPSSTLQFLLFPPKVHNLSLKIPNSGAAGTRIGTMNRGLNRSGGVRIRA
ncbi:hypothetical protein K458DRAFT_460571, partial [Lentithecium fluviatile CBS 122367]